MTDIDAAVEHVTSLDGTRIGFSRCGTGPGVVLVQGAVATATQFRDLALLLSTSLTVITPDRRGRGSSAKSYDRGHRIARDVEDLDAVLSATGADRVFGLSSGAMVALEAARTLPRIVRVAVYEPPFYPAGISFDGIRRLAVQIERGDLAAALVTALAVSGTAPAPVRHLPRPVAQLVARIVLAVDDRRGGPYAKLRELLPGVRFDFQDVGEMDGRMGTLASLATPTLLLSGSRSAGYLRESIRTLTGVIPRAQHVEFPGLDHSSAWNTDCGGRPDVVAPVLRKFFA